jgi:hypothetical protein
MEPLFTNEYQMTEKINIEFAKKHFHKYLKKTRNILLILALYMLFGVVNSFIKNIVGPATIILLFLAGVFIYFSFFYIIVFAKISYKNLTNLHGPIAIMTVRFYDDYIESCTQTSSSKYTYDMFAGVLKSENIYALMLGKNKVSNQGIIIKKDSFKGIDEAGFLSFIHSKCPNMK